MESSLKEFTSSSEILPYPRLQGLAFPANVDALTAKDMDRIIEMAWEDRTPFDAIKYQFGLTESKVRNLMKAQLSFRAYKNWRARVEACKTKHEKTRVAGIVRFRCDRQRAISQNSISKRR